MQRGTLKENSGTYHSSVIRIFVKFNLRTKFTTHKLLGHIKKNWFFNIKIPTSSFFAKPWGGVAESRVNLEIDSATAGMKALVQNDRSVNGLGWILDSQKMKISLRWNPYLSSLPVFLIGMKGAVWTSAHPSCIDAKRQFKGEFRYSSFIRNMKFSIWSWTYDLYSQLLSFFEIIKKVLVL